MYLPSETTHCGGHTLTLSHKPAILPDPEFQNSRTQLQPACCSSPHVYCSYASSPPRPGFCGAWSPFLFSSILAPCCFAFLPVDFNYCPHSPQALSSLSLLVFPPTWPAHIHPWVQPAICLFRASHLWIAQCCHRKSCTLADR